MDGRDLCLCAVLPGGGVSELGGDCAGDLVWWAAVLRNEHFLSCCRSGTGCCRGSSAAVTLGVLIAFIQYAQRFFRPIQDLSDKYNILQAAMAASERIFKLLDTQAEIVSPAVPVAGDGSGGWSFAMSGLRISGWMRRRRLGWRRRATRSWRSFADIEWILSGVSFVVEPDETAAIVGHTGAGKTTIIGLMMRFYDIQRGSMLVDGVDVREQDLQRADVGDVTREKPIAILFGIEQPETGARQFLGAECKAGGIKSGGYNPERGETGRCAGGGGDGNR